MNSGVIKHIDKNNGWGFIEGDDGDDYFFNVQNARPGQNLNSGDFVKFDYYQTQKGPSAKNILKIKS